MRDPGRGPLQHRDREWACNAPPELRAGRGLPGLVPDLVTNWRVLTAADLLALERVIGSWSPPAWRSASPAQAGSAGGGRQDAVGWPRRGGPGPVHLAVFGHVGPSAGNDLYQLDVRDSIIADMPQSVTRCSSRGTGATTAGRHKCPLPRIIWVIPG